MILVSHLIAFLVLMHNAFAQAPAAKPVPHVTGAKALQCKFDMSSQDNKTIFNTLTFPLKADDALADTGLEGMLGPFKVQVLFHASKYGQGPAAANYLDKLTLTVWEGKEKTSPVAITVAGNSDVPLDLPTLNRTRHMVTLTKTTKIVYFCSSP